MSTLVVNSYQSDFEYFAKAAATPILGSTGKVADRFRCKWFPQDDRYLFRCRTVRQTTAYHTLQPKPLPPLDSLPRKWCCLGPKLPKYVELELPLDGVQQRIEVSLQSLANRCSYAKGMAVTQEQVYEACAGKRFPDFLYDIGQIANERIGKGKAARDSEMMDIDLDEGIAERAEATPSPVQRKDRAVKGSSEDERLVEDWLQKLHPCLVELQTPESIIRLTVSFVVENRKTWAKTKEPSLFFPANSREKHPLDVEYFRKNGAIFVYYAGKDGKTVGVQLTGDVINPELRILNKQQLAIYKKCAESDFQVTPGIPKIYRISEYADRSHVLIERYYDNLKDLLASAVERSVSSNGSSGRKSPHRRKLSSISSLALFSLRSKVKIAEDLLFGLSKLHEADIAHLNLEPSVVIIERQRDFQAKAFIGRLELATQIKTSSADEDVRVSTKLNGVYLPPEFKQSGLGPEALIAKDRAPFACDVYSLGKCLEFLFESPESAGNTDDDVWVKQRVVTTLKEMTKEGFDRYTAHQALNAFSKLKEDMIKKYRTGEEKLEAFEQKYSL